MNGNDPGAEEQFVALYEQYRRRVAEWFWYRLPAGPQHLADDLTQETFIVVWDHLSKGRGIDYPFAFLKTVAKGRLSMHFRSPLRGAAVTPVDFAGVVTVEVELAIEHRYATGDPELAMVAAELDTALERMRAASARWRELHAEVAKYRASSERHKSAATAGQRLAKAERTARLRDEALPELQEACRMVGRLRGEMERLGGSGYRSSTGWPPSPALDGSMRRGALSDPTVRQCPDRHCLDDLDNVRFQEDGTRRCRACHNETAGRHRRQKAGVAS